MEGKRQQEEKLRTKERLEYEGKAKKIHDAAMKDYKGWVEKEDISKLRDYVSTILEPLSFDEEQLEFFLSAPSMKEWKKVFTHVSVDSENNYEKYEKIGDAVAKLKFLEYLYQYYPSITKPGDISIQVDVNLSNERMKEITQKFGMDRMLRIEGDINIKILGDLFEGLFGVINQLGNKIELGMGSAMTQNLMIFVMMFHIIDINQQKDPRTLFKEIYDKLGKQKAPKEQNHLVKKGVIEMKIIYPDTGEIIGQAVGPEDSREVRDEAYSQALEWLKKQGVTLETAKEEKLKRDRLNPIYDSEYKRAEQAVQALNIKLNPKAPKIEGFIVEVKKYPGIRGGQETAALLLTMKDQMGKVRTLEQLTATAESFQMASIEVMKNFADQTKIPPGQIPQEPGRPREPSRPRESGRSGRSQSLGRSRSNPRR